MAGLLALAHERTCEAELAHLLAAELEAGRTPDLEAMRACFARPGAETPHVTVHLAALCAYDEIAPWRPVIGPPPGGSELLLQEGVA